jgi:hypothetical protein
MRSEKSGGGAGVLEPAGIDDESAENAMSGANAETPDKADAASKPRNSRRFIT